MASELPVLAAASVQTGATGNEPGRLRRPLKQREDDAANRRNRDHDADQEGRSPTRTAAEEVPTEVLGSRERLEANARETESPEHELDVKL